MVIDGVGFNHEFFRGMTLDEFIEAMNSDKFIHLFSGKGVTADERKKKIEQVYNTLTIAWQAMSPSVFEQKFIDHSTYMNDNLPTTSEPPKPEHPASNEPKPGRSKRKASRDTAGAAVQRGKK